MFFQKHNIYIIAVVPKLKLHLDDQLRLNEIGQCVKQIFSYEDITSVLYSEEHSAFLQEHDASVKQELDSVIEAQQNQVAELQSEIKHLHEQLESAIKEREFAQRESEILRARLKKKKHLDKGSFDHTAKSLQKLHKRKGDNLF